jgi:plasmid replication initiation protein
MDGGYDEEMETIPSGVSKSSGALPISGILLEEIQTEKASRGMERKIDNIEFECSPRIRHHQRYPERKKQRMLQIKKIREGAETRVSPVVVQQFLRKETKTLQSHNHRL